MPSHGIGELAFLALAVIVVSVVYAAWTVRQRRIPDPTVGRLLAIPPEAVPGPVADTFSSYVPTLDAYEAGGYLTESTSTVHTFFMATWFDPSRTIAAVASYQQWHPRSLLWKSLSLFTIIREGDLVSIVTTDTRMTATTGRRASLRSVTVHGSNAQRLLTLHRTRVAAVDPDCIVRWENLAQLVEYLEKESAATGRWCLATGKMRVRPDGTWQLTWTQCLRKATRESYGKPLFLLWTWLIERHAIRTASQAVAFVGSP